ncbi:hypothetical protein AVEN_165088-1 [Araneus ventricosus]|uniref:Uncharacterized protein n=1 Tax=Araneus ventricosus TaxID=182803 RepID=A0A4Y2PD48_ARAVE|nr:hypothetical protein AVEN_165088-1 [Araneus ventricosus]
MDMNSDSQNFNRSQESQCLPFTFQSHQENEFVQSNPIYHQNFRYSQGSSQMNIRQLGSFPQIQKNIENNFQVNSQEFDVLQPKSNNLASVSEERIYSRNLLHKNRNFGDSVVSNQHFRFDTSGTLNIREMQSLKMKHQAENIGHTIPQTHKLGTSYQDHPQTLGIQPSVPGPPFPGQFSEERCVSKEKFYFSPSDIKSGHQDITNCENMLQVESRDGYLYPDYKNINNSTFSNQYLPNEGLRHLNQQCLQENMIAHSTQQFQDNRMISEKLHETFNVQSVPQRLADNQTKQIQAAYSNHGSQISRTYADGKFFQGEQPGEYSYFENTNIKYSTDSNQYLVNEEHLPLNQQCLQKIVSIPPTQVYQGNRMISEEFPRTFNFQTCIPRLSDPGHSISIHNSWRKQGIQQSRTYTGGNTLSNPLNNPTSDIENNSRQVSETTLDFLKNMNLGINTDNLWDESPNSVNHRAICTTR